MDTTRLGTLLGNGETISVLASADATAWPNAAVFGSPRLLDDGRVAVGLADNRTWSNLKVNPRAVLLAFQPAPQVVAWRGLRAYLELEEARDSGPLYDQFLADIASVAGKGAARMVRRVALFRVLELRPLLDMPHGAG